MLPLALTALLLADAPPPPPAKPRPPRVWRDAALAAGASAIVAMAKPDIRRAILHDGRFKNIAHNFGHPLSAVRAGTRLDDDPFWVNDVAHPVSFAAEALYLKHEGYGDGAAFLFTQVHSVVWEFAIEGSAFPPSGKDLIADGVGAAAAIWIVRPLLAHRRARDRVAFAVAPARGGGRIEVVTAF